MGRIARRDFVVETLLGWGLGELRDLPWRRTREPWGILVSEVMLQQTSVARVLPKFEAFMHRFPTPGELASSPLGDALELWSGLGYPRRCRNLHRAAETIVAEHDGRVPKELDDLLALPGVGAYTARAVACFAHGDVVAVCDVNVARVLSRLTGEPMKASALQQLADDLVPADSAWEWNQMIMDFGARQCTARSPMCGTCPLSTACAWRGEGDDPARRSAMVSRPQARFEGSDRQARGKAVRAVIDGASERRDVVAAMGLAHDTTRASALLDDLVAEGLLRRSGRGFNLP